MNGKNLTEKLAIYMLAYELIDYEDDIYSFSKNAEKNYEKNIKTFNQYFDEEWSKDVSLYFRKLMKRKNHFLNILYRFYFKKPEGYMEFMDKRLIIRYEYLKKSLGYTVNTENFTKFKRDLEKNIYDSEIIINNENKSKWNGVEILEISFFTDIIKKKYENDYVRNILITMLQEELVTLECAKQLVSWSVKDEEKYKKLKYIFNDVSGKIWSLNTYQEAQENIKYIENTSSDSIKYINMNNIKYLQKYSVNNVFNILDKSLIENIIAFLNLKILDKS
ncbi:MAG: hypothetical protein ACTTGJ_01755 [Clostridium sp.]